MNQPNPFKWRHFESDIIRLGVRWYLRYALSYRDLEEMMRQRGLQVDHTTIYRSRPAVCPRTGQTLSAAPQSHNRRYLPDKQILGISVLLF